MSTRAAFRDEDVCKLRILRPLLTGKPFMDDLPPASSVTLSGKDEAPDGERKATVRASDGEVGAGREEKVDRSEREVEEGKGLLSYGCPVNLFSQHCVPVMLEGVKES